MGKAVPETEPLFCCKFCFTRLVCTRERLPRKELPPSYGVVLTRLGTRTQLLRIGEIKKDRNLVSVLLICRYSSEVNTP